MNSALTSTFKGTRIVISKSVSADYTFDDQIEAVNVDASGGPVTITLPLISANAGRLLTIRKIDSGANAVTIETSGPDLFEGGTSTTLNNQWELLSIDNDGNEWHTYSGGSGGGGGGISSLAAIGSSPNANGATIAGVTLNLQPASASFGGVVTTGTQTLAGYKIFAGAVEFQDGLFARNNIGGGTGIWAQFGSTGTQYWAVGQTATVPYINITSTTSTYSSAPIVSDSSITAASVVVNGNLTVDTNTLFVDSTNNRVGMGTVSPSEVLHVTGNVRFSGALMPNNAAGTVGQVLLSGGTGSPPTWFTSSAPETLAAIGSSPNANGATLSANTLTLQPASASFGGVVTTGTQTFTGAKTFDTATTISASSGNVLIVDTNTLVVDATNNRIGIGTASPTKALDVVGQGVFSDILGLAQIATGSLPAAGAGNEGYIVYDSTTNTVKFSDGASWANIGGAATISIGSTVTSGTAGSILFVGAASALSQDNAGLFWDDANNRLGLGTASPSFPFHLIGSGNAKAYIVNGFATNNPAVVIDCSAGKTINMTAGTGGVGFIWDDSCSLAFVSDSAATIRAGTTGNSGTVRGGFDSSYNFYVGASPGNSLIASNTAVGIGTTNIFAGQLMINNSNSGAVGAHLWLNNPNNVVDSAVRISFNNDTTTDSTPQAVLDVINNQTGNFQSDFVFKQWNGTSLLERVRFKSNGEIHFTSGGAGTSGYVLTSNGTGTNPSWTAPTLPIGSTVTSGTSGSILFVGAASALSQDNANLFWDNTDNVLQTTGGLVVGNEIGGAVPGSHMMQIVPASATQTPLTIIGGDGNIYIWKATIGANGATMGLGQNGGPITNDFIINTIDGASVYTERLRFVDGGGITTNDNIDLGTVGAILNAASLEGQNLTITGQGSFTDIVGLGQIPTGSLPAASGVEGYIVYDSTTQNVKFSNGTDWISTGSSVLFFGATTQGLVTEYVWPGYGSASSSTNEIGVLAPFSGIVKALYIKADTAPTGDTVAFTVRLNGVDQALTATLSGTTASDTTNSFAVTAGDEISIKSEPGAGISAGADGVRISISLTPT